jgi:hypothetical protein
VCRPAQLDSLLGAVPVGTDGGDTLNDQIPDPVPPELAPFLANARVDLAAATDGLQPHEVVEHLETTVARAEFEASRLGMRIDPLAAESEPLTVTDDDPVVVIRRLVEPDEG